MAVGQEPVIFGLDLGTRSFALVGLPQALEDGQPVFFFAKTEKTTRWEELRSLARLLDEYVKFNDRVFIEEPPLAGSRNIRVLIGLAQTSGALLAASQGPSYLVPVASWKAAVVGRGNADKQQVADWLETSRPDLFALCGYNQNLVDAACIALYGVDITENAPGKDADS